MISGLSGRLAAVVSAAVLIVVLLVGWFALISPQKSKAADLNNQISYRQVQLDTTQRYLKSPAAHENVRKLRRLQAALPDNAKMSEILRQLSATAQAANVGINGITPLAVTPGAGAVALPITLTIQGHYFAIVNFLQLLRERADLKGDSPRIRGRLYTVDGIQFGNAAGSTAGGSTTPGSSAGSTGLIGATINMDAFVYGSSAPAPPPTTTTPADSTTGSSATGS
jgi:hypothetical protein